jgi:hypothetical protein
MKRVQTEKSYASKRFDPIKQLTKSQLANDNSEATKNLVKLNVTLRVPTILIGFHFRGAVFKLVVTYVPTVPPTSRLASLFLIFLIKLGPLASK